MIDAVATFRKYEATGTEDEFLEFERIAEPRHPRPDMCAFLILHDLCPETGDMVTAAEHDQIWLAVGCEALSAVATEEQIRDLTRCGVFLDSEDESLSMFV